MRLTMIVKQKVYCLPSLFFLLIFFLTTSIIAEQNEYIDTPKSYFGFQPGADRMLFDYEELIVYLQKLDAASPRLKMLEIGESPMGKKMYIAFFSSEGNIENLERLKEINRRLALDPAIPPEERTELIKEGKVFFLATLSMHSNEVGPSQSAPLIAYELVTTEDPQKMQQLDDVVYMMVPCHNPDGMDMVVNNYRKFKNTKYEGASLPGIYHKYVGHDNNRDFVTLSQSDTKAIARICNTEWYPQVMIEKHQMGNRTARYFVPPMHDPITENIDATLWNWTWVFGSNMVTDMTKKGLMGISQHYLFDDYWPGSTETCIWKNVIGMLSEAASVKYATPVFVEQNELMGYGKGLSEYKKSINMPDPWPGGWWRLSDIVQYEIESTFSIIKTSSLRKDDILKFRNDLAVKEFQNGQTEPPFYYILPKQQHDPGELIQLVELLREHGVSVYKLNKSLQLSGKVYQEGAVVVPLAQPIRPFIKEVMEAQRFPVRHYTPGGEIIKPYDITSWSLPLHRGVNSDEIKERSAELEEHISRIGEDYFQVLKPVEPIESVLFSVNHNASYRAAFHAAKLGLKVERLSDDLATKGSVFPKGSFLVTGNGESLNKILTETMIESYFNPDMSGLGRTRFNVPRIALVETYFHDMDAGWTRFVLDSYHISYKVVRPGKFKETDFVKNYDVIVFPGARKSVLMQGKYESKGIYYVSSYPPEFTKGIGKDGMEKLMSFLDEGGIIVAWGRSTDLFMGPLEIKRGKDKKEDFQLPVRNIAEDLKKEKLYCPGSLVKVQLLDDHPLTLGLPDEIGVFFRGRPVFSTSIPNFDMDRRVIGKFPENEILMSGYCENVEKLGNRTVMAWLKKGKGQLVFMGFNPQFRASTQGSYKLLFNALLLPELN